MSKLTYSRSIETIEDAWRNCPNEDKVDILQAIELLKAAYKSELDHEEILLLIRGNVLKQVHHMLNFAKEKHYGNEIAADFVAYLASLKYDLTPKPQEQKESEECVRINSCSTAECVGCEGCKDYKKESGE